MEEIPAIIKRGRVSFLISPNSNNKGSPGVGGKRDIGEKMRKGFKRMQGKRT